MAFKKARITETEDGKFVVEHLIMVENRTFFRTKLVEVWEKHYVVDSIFKAIRCTNATDVTIKLLHPIRP